MAPAARCRAHGAPADRRLCAHLVFGHAAGVNRARDAAWCDGCQAASVARSSQPVPQEVCAACFDAALARNHAPRFELVADGRTRLRTPRRQDAEAIYALVDANRAHLHPWLPWVEHSTSANDTRGFLDLAIAGQLDGRSLNLVIEHDGAIAGMCGFNVIDAANLVCEIGYWLRADLQGRGIVGAGCRALVEHAFASLGLNCVRLAAATGNARSRAIPERLGFHLDGVIREQEWVAGRFVDHAVYTRLRREWSAG